MFVLLLQRTNLGRFPKVTRVLLLVLGLYGVVCDESSQGNCGLEDDVVVQLPRLGVLT